MNYQTIVDGMTSEQWREWTSEFADHNVYQTWAYGELRAAEMGAKVSRLVVQSENKIVGMAQVRVKRIPLSRAGIAYVYHGPLWRRRADGNSDPRSILKALRDEYAVRSGLAVRVVPNLALQESGDGPIDAFASAGFQRNGSAEPYRTILLDLSPSLEELRRRLAQKWRNGLNQSEKRGLVVRSSNDVKAMDDFEILYESMWAKKRFDTGVSVRQFRELQRAMHDSETLRVLTAYADDEPVAGHVSSTLGDTCVYLLGASVERGRTLKASYLLQWRMVELARASGARWYDLGGVDPRTNPGVYHFKSGLNGVECEFVGQYDFCCAPSSRILIPLGDRAWKALRAVRRARAAPSA